MYIRMHKDLHFKYLIVEYCVCIRYGHNLQVAIYYTEQ